LREIAAGLSGRGREFKGFKCERAGGGDDFAIAAVHADLDAETGDAFAIAKVGGIGLIPDFYLGGSEEIGETVGG